MICRVQECTRSRPTAGTPITSLTTVTGKGSRTRSTRSAGGPSRMIPSTRPSRISCARGRNRLAAPTVNAPATARRSRLWSGWSAKAREPGRGLKCGASRVICRFVTSARPKRGSLVIAFTSSYRVASHAQPSPCGNRIRVSGPSRIRPARTGSNSGPSRSRAGQSRTGGGDWPVSVLVSWVIPPPWPRPGPTVAR